MLILGDSLCDNYDGEQHKSGENDQLLSLAKAVDPAVATL